MLSKFEIRTEHFPIERLWTLSLPAFTERFQNLEVSESLNDSAILQNHLMIHLKTN